MAVSANAYLRVRLCPCVHVYACALRVQRQSAPGSADEVSVALTRCTAVMNTFESFHSMCAHSVARECDGHARCVARECDGMEPRVPQMPEGRSGPVPWALHTGICNIQFSFLFLEIEENS